MRCLTTALGATFALCILAASRAHAQGGPPMLTDDPGTPGNGHFELNLAGTLEANSTQQLWELPTLDLNYGVGSNIQLNFETSYVVLKPDDAGPLGGMGAASIAIKWRFLDEKTAGLSVSTFPRIERALLHSSIRRGLADDGTQFFLPIEVARSFDPVDLDFEIGPLLSTIGRSEWSYGIVGGVSLNDKFKVMAELHGNARANFSRNRLTANVGLRQEFNPSVALIASLGHDLRAPSGEPSSLVSYFGVQLEF